MNSQPMTLATRTTAADMLGVTPARISQLIANGTLGVVEMARAGRGPRLLVNLEDVRLYERDRQQRSYNPQVQNLVKAREALAAKRAAAQQAVAPAPVMTDAERVAALEEKVSVLYRMMDGLV